MRPKTPDDVPGKFKKLLEAPEVFAVDTPVYPGRDGSPTFPLAFTHSGAGEDRPVLVIIPGGPGFASIVPYATIRPKAVTAGFEVVMVEHRGVGLSRKDAAGEDLPVGAMRVEYVARDLRTVLDHLGIDRAWIHGTSYGGYLSQIFGAMFPGKVAGMFLDCTWHAAAGEEQTREYNRDLFLRGVRPEGFPEGLSPRTEPAAAKVREVLEKGVAPEHEVVAVVPPAYELLGPEVLDLVLGVLLAGRRREWNWFAGFVERELDGITRYVMEAEPSVAIHYRQLYDLSPDGKPFDTALTWSARSHRYPSFEGEPYNLSGELAKFDWPAVLLSGERDTRTPPFRLEQISRLLPHSTHVTFPNVGHDLLRFRAREALPLEAAAVRGGVEEAARAAGNVVTDGRRHPLTLAGRTFGGYLAARETVARPAARWVAASLAAATALGLLARYRRRSRRPGG